MSKKKEIEHPEELFQHCVRYTDRKMTYAEGNRNNYIFLLACNCNRRGLPEDQTLYFCCEQFDLSSDEIKNTVASAYKKTEEHGKYKDDEDKPRQVQIDEIENFLLERYVFRYNVVTGKLEYHPHTRDKFEPVTDYKENSLLREIKKAQIKCNSTLLHTILNSDFCPEYNPFTSYFASLPAWDGTDHIGTLAATVTTTESHWDKCFRKWLVAAVASAINDKIINHTVIVFTGKQGIGKTTWIEKLVPDELSDYLFSGTIQPNNKDTLINLSECFLINLDELENLSQSEIGSLKEIITKSKIRIRRPYGRNNETMPRRGSFAGSVNTAQFLTDTTGSRRFLCFPVTAIDYKAEINMAQVYAQALDCFKTGFQYWFNMEEIVQIAAQNEKFQVSSPEEELLLTYFPKPDKDETFVQHLTSTEIAGKISDKYKVKITVRSLGRALHKHQYKSGKIKGRQVWAVIENSPEEVARIAKEEMDGEKRKPTHPRSKSNFHSKGRKGRNKSPL